MTAVPVVLDERFRTAAAASGELDVAFDVLGDTPVGALLVGVSDRGLCRVGFDPQPEAELERLARDFGPRVLRSAKAVDRVRRELDEYFAGRRRAFDLDLDLRAAPTFHRRVLAELSRVEYGHTTTYGALAAQVGSPRRRNGDEPEPRADRPPLPPRRRREREARRLRRWARAEGVAAPARGRTPLAFRRRPPRRG
jgi:hypothetical protein